MSYQWRRDKSHEVEGNWWVAGSEDNQVAGRLTYDPVDGLNLNLIGDFSGSADLLGTLRSFFVKQTPFTIHGRGPNGPEVTLLGCFNVGFVRNCARVRANLALIGTHHLPESSAQVSGCRLQANNFDSWVAGFHFDVEQPDWKKMPEWREGANEGNVWKIAVKPGAGSPLSGRINSIPAQVEILHGVAFRRDINDIDMKYEASLKLQLDSDVTLGDASWLSHRILQLLNLLIGRPTHFTVETYEMSDGSAASLLASSWAKAKPVNISSDSIVCPLTIEGFDFLSLLDGWLRIAPNISPSINLLFGVLMKTATFLETEISEITQALEGYCTQTDSFQYIEDDRFNILIDEMLIPVAKERHDFRQRVQGTLKYLNRASLRTKLTRLCKRLDPKIRDNVIGQYSVRSFVDEAVTARNEITHPQIGSVWDRRDESQMLELITRLKMLLIVAMLEDAGMPREILRSQYGNCFQWQWG